MHCLSFYLWNICFMPLLNHNNSVYFCIIIFYTTLLFTLKNVLPLEAHKGHWTQNYYHSQCFLIVFENFLIPHKMKNPWSPLDLKVIQKKMYASTQHQNPKHLTSLAILKPQQTTLCPHCHINLEKKHFNGNFKLFDLSVYQM